MTALIDRDATLERMKSMAGCATCDNYNYVRCRACIWDDAMNIVEEMSEIQAASEPPKEPKKSIKDHVCNNDYCELE